MALTPARVEPSPSGWQRRRASLLLLAALLAVAAVLQLVVSARRQRDPALALVMHPEPRRLPALAFVDADAHPTSLAAVRGKVVLLNIWATWCAPCRQEMPALDRLQGRLGSSGLEVVALSIDTGAEGLAAIKAFYASAAIRHLRTYNDAEGTAGFLLGAPGVPTTLLLDRQGRELGRISGPAHWDSDESVALLHKQLALTEPLPGPAR